MPATPKYTIDTCSITAMRKIYPQDVFPGVWDKMNELVQNGTVVSSDQVLDELNAQDDAVSAWAEGNKDMFLPLDEEIQQQASEILASHRKLIDLKRRKSGADPFVIATAMVKHTAVVTDEKPSGGPGKVKIPDVCKVLKIECVTLLEMLRAEGLKI